VAGLEDATAGEILLDGGIVTDVAAADRGAAMVFQSYALYPHQTVYGNLAFPLKMARRPRADIDARVRAVATLLDIDGLLERLPRELSGGQRQRVAMGRAMIREPKLFLFDEPLSNLDVELRVRMRLEIGRLQRQLGITTLYVTHDQTEAMTLADRLVVLREGRVEQIGTPMEVYHRPATRFVAGFMGTPPMNFLPIREAEATAGGTRFVLGPDLSVTLPVRLAGPAEVLGIRPEHLRIAAEGEGGALLPPLAHTRPAAEHLGERSYGHATTPSARSPAAAGRRHPARERSRCRWWLTSRPCTRSCGRPPGRSRGGLSVAMLGLVCASRWSTPGIIGAAVRGQSGVSRAAYGRRRRVGTGGGSGPVLLAATAMGAAALLAMALAAYDPGRRLDRERRLDGARLRAATRWYCRPACWPCPRPGPPAWSVRP
jgi:ABC-type sugar transport system ATPase subunit